jgi:hypothetical protein
MPGLEKYSGNPNSGKERSRAGEAGPAMRKTDRFFLIRSAKPTSSLG